MRSSCLGLTQQRRLPSRGTAQPAGLWLCKRYLFPPYNRKRHLRLARRTLASSLGELLGIFLWGGAGTGGRVETAQARQHHPGRHQALCQRLTSQRTGRAPTRQSVPTTSMFSTRARVGKIDSSSVGVSVSRSRRHSMLKPPQIPSSSGFWRKMPEAAPDSERTWTSVFSDMTSTAVVTDRYFVCFSVVLIDQWSGL